MLPKLVTHNRLYWQYFRQHFLNIIYFYQRNSSAGTTTSQFLNIMRPYCALDRRTILCLYVPECEKFVGTMKRNEIRTKEEQREHPCCGIRLQCTKSTVWLLTEVFITQIFSSQSTKLYCALCLYTLLTPPPPLNFLPPLCNNFEHQKCAPKKTSWSKPFQMCPISPISYIFL